MIIAGNFKTNHTRSSVLTYCKDLDFLLQNGQQNEKVYVFPPSSSLPYGDFAHFRIGVQNAYPTSNGAFTGEIGLEQIRELRISTLMIGHSERRRILGESDALCKMKFDFFAQQGMSIFFCIGEDQQVREKGGIEEFLQGQLKGIDLSYSSLIVAYEPIWAIGTGVSAKLEEIEQVCTMLKAFGCPKVIYGGSVNAGNAGEIMALKGVDGVLVGGACLDLKHFFKIIRAGTCTLDSAKNQG